VIATGQISIIDYNDALTLTGFISSNKPKTQQYNPDNGVYNPDWSASNLTLTPSLFILGSSDDIISSAQVQSITWYDAEAPSTPLATDTNYTVPTSGLKTLTIKKNVLAAKVAKDYICVIVYRDVTTNLDLTYKTSISFNKVVNGGGIADAVAWCPDGNIFKNDSIATIKAHCDLWRGSTIDTTLVTYQWYKQDSTVSTDQGAGVGWRKLDGTTNYGITGYTTNEITVPNSAVLNIAVFKCQIKDTDPASNTYNDYFYDTVTIVDQSDPVQVSVTSSGGDVFKNGVGSTTLTAKLFRGGEEIDSAGTTYAYKWYKYDKDSALVANWGGAGIDYKTGKTLSVGSNDVDVKATFIVEVE
jgi:hypothetical protein